MRFMDPFDAGVMVRERGNAAAKESGRVGGGGREEGEGGAWNLRGEADSREGDLSELSG